MDTRTGQLYESKAAAEAAGVRAVPVYVKGGVITVITGPFKGRRYVTDPNGRRGQRVKPDATAAEIEALRTERATAW